MKKLICVLFVVITVAVAVPAMFAQEEGTTLVSPLSMAPSSHQMSGFRYEPQGWNNCGPATLTMGLSYFGYQNNQTVAAAWLKPDYEDKNVSPWQMEEFVNTQVPGTPAP